MGSGTFREDKLPVAVNSSVEDLLAGLSVAIPPNEVRKLSVAKNLQKYSFKTRITRSNGVEDPPRSGLQMNILPCGYSEGGPYSPRGYSTNTDVTRVKEWKALSRPSKVSIPQALYFAEMHCAGVETS